MNHLEDDNQAALFKWSNYFKQLDLMHSIPNGGFRNAREGARLKRQGAKAGVWDIFLPMAMKGYHGLYIEMKHGKNKLTEKQNIFGSGVKKNGYLTAVCYSWEDAKRVITDYAELNKF